MSDNMKCEISDKRIVLLHDFYKELSAKKWDFMFLVTRKGYWMYKILNLFDAELEKPGIYSDRYLTKMLNSNCIEGKNIYLIDDTLNRGYNLFHFFCVLKSRGVGRITPYVFAQSIEFPQNVRLDDIKMIYYDVFSADRGNEIHAMQLWQEFLGSLRCSQYMSRENISKLCLFEVKMFQEYLCPLVIDLPILVPQSEGGNVLENRFELSEEQFLRLCKETKEWVYQPNIYGRDGGESDQYAMDGNIGIPVQCNFFEYKNPELDPLFQTVMLDMVVKCKYNRRKNGGYSVVFTPFAIVRTWKKEHLRTVFLLLAGDTDYGKRLLSLPNENSENSYYWTAMLRFVIYALSLYVGEKFKAYLAEVTGIKAGYDWNIIKQNSGEDFIKGCQSMLSENRLGDRIMLELAEKCDAMVEKVSLKQEGKEEYLLKNAFDTVFLMIKDKYAVNSANTLKIEEIERAIAGKFVFADNAQLRRGIVKVILIMLETSAFGNHVSVTEESVERAFRRGESSSLLLSKTGELCYSCAEILYLSAGKTGYERLKAQYFEEIEEYMKDKSYFDKDIRLDFFEKYIDLFTGIPQNMLHGEIMGKRFLLESIDEKTKELRKTAIIIADKLMKNTL